MKTTRKNAAILTLCAFFLFSCSGKSQEQKQARCNHNFKDLVVKPTCEENGYILHTCSKCGYEYKNHATGALGHEYVLHEAKDASLDGDGWKKHYTCERCDAYFDKNKDIVSKNDVILHVDFLQYADSEEPIYLMHGNLTVDFNYEKYASIIGKYDQMVTSIQNASIAFVEVSQYINDISNIYYSAYKNQVILSVISDANPTQENYANTNDMSSKTIESYAKYVGIYVITLRSSYKYDLIPGHSDSYYEALAKSYEGTYNQEVAALDTAMQSILNDYKSGTKTAYQAFAQYVKKANDYAEYYDYSDYLTYSYSNIYGRDYSLSDTSTLKTYIDSYITPAYSTLYASYQDMIDKTKYMSDYSDAYVLEKRASNAFFGNYLQELRDYASFIGNDYDSNFNDFLVNGSYFLSNIYNPNMTAYVNSFLDGTPFMFMSKNYQNVSTFVHEFGHYNAALTFGGLTSYDLAETQSQGNEMLYYSYLMKNKMDEITGKFFITEQVLDIMSTVLYGYAINELERFAYKNENFTSKQLFDKWVSIGNSIGLDFTYSENYMYTVLLNYQGYYISYAMSAVASLEIFAKAMTNMNTAKNAYKSIFTKNSTNEGFKTSLTNAGLYSVLDEKAYKLIKDAIALI